MTTCAPCTIESATIKLVEKSAYTPKDIIQKVCDVLSEKPDSLLRDSRTPEKVFARNMCYLFLYTKTSLGYKAIGKLFKRDHTTIIHGVKSIRNWIETEEYAASIFYELDMMSKNYKRLPKPSKKIIKTEPIEQPFVRSKGDYSNKQYY